MVVGGGGGGGGGRKGQKLGVGYVYVMSRSEIYASYPCYHMLMESESERSERANTLLYFH